MGRVLDIGEGIVSPDKNLVLAVSANGVAQLYTAGGDLRYTVHEFEINAANAVCCFDRSGKHFLLQNLDDTLLVFETSSGRRIHYFRPAWRYSAAALSPNGDQLALASDDFTSTYPTSLTITPIQQSGCILYVTPTTS